jgi:hypothetical protein
MSQVTHATFPNQLRSHWLLAVSALVALMVTVAIVLVIAADGGSAETSGPVAKASHPAARSDGGPDESSVAAAVSGPVKVQDSRAYVSESNIAAAISGR